MDPLLNPLFGRINRGEWWVFQVLIFAMAFLLALFTAVVFADRTSPVEERNFGETVMLGVVLFQVVYMNFSTCLNRLRDTERSGLWYFTFLVPMIGIAIMIYRCGLEAGKGKRKKERQPQRAPSAQIDFGRGSDIRRQAFGSR